MDSFRAGLAYDSAAFCTGVATSPLLLCSSYAFPVQSQAESLVVLSLGVLGSTFTTLEVWEGIPYWLFIQGKIESRKCKLCVEEVCLRSAGIVFTRRASHCGSSWVTTREGSWWVRTHILGKSESEQLCLLSKESAEENQITPFYETLMIILEGLWESIKPLPFIYI